MSNPLRDDLLKSLKDAVTRHGIVVWQDDEAAYRRVVETVTPEGVELRTFTGSWMELRHKLEPALAAATPPAVIVYVPTARPEQDPLAEARVAGFEFRRPLKELVRVALRTHVGQAQIDTIADRARTLEEAEAMAATGGHDVSIAALLGPGSNHELIARFLLGQHDAQLTDRDAWGELHLLLKRELGVVSSRTGPDLRTDIVRQLVLSLIDSAGALSERLRPALTSPSDTQQTARAHTIDAWWRMDTPAARAALRTSEREVELAADLIWSDELSTVDVLRAVDRAAEVQCVAALKDGDASAALELATERLRSRLVRAAMSSPGVDSELPARWRSVRALAELNEVLQRLAPPAPTTSSSGILQWYAAEGWRVDRAHRRLELALTALPEFGELEESVSLARQRYETWLGKLVERYTGALERDGFDLGELIHQTSIHPRFVAAAEGQVAYIWVDAMRYEFGEEIEESLRQAGHTVHLEAAVAAAPTITPVGMAALCPGASASFGIDERDGTLRVSVQGSPVTSVPDRVALMRGAHGTVVDLELGECVQRGEKALAKDLKGASAVLVRSQELDSAGENGLLSAQWSAFDELTQTIPRVVSKLGKAGVRRVVITADHGFIALSRRLGDAYKIDAPQGGNGELHRRAWIGRGATTHPSVLRLPLGTLGVTTDADVSILVPRELALFKAGGSKQFFHGGLSPQELVIPVIVADLAQTATGGAVKVGVDVVGGRITTAMFAASLNFTGDLFTTAVRVRLVARKGKDVSVARVSAGDGFDEDTGTVTLDESNAHPRLMFQVTKSLDPEDDLELQVVDAATDVLLGKASVKVAAPIRTAFDDLDA